MDIDKSYIKNLVEEQKKGENCIVYNLLITCRINLNNFK